MSKKKINKQEVLYEFPEKGKFTIYEKNVSQTEKLPDNKWKAEQLEHLQEDDMAFSIVQATIDGEDCTKSCLDDDVFLAFYERDGKLHFANVWQKAGGQSYGEVSEIIRQEINEGGYHTVRASYLWYYSSTDFNKTGTAQILLRLIHRPITVAFELSILTESANLMIYKGYVNGSLDWKPF